MEPPAPDRVFFALQVGPLSKWRAIGRVSGEKNRRRKCLACLGLKSNQLPYFWSVLVELYQQIIDIPMVSMSKIHIIIVSFYRPFCKFVILLNDFMN